MGDTWHRAQEDSMLRLWDLEEESGILMGGHEHAITHIAFSSDSQKIISASNDKLRLYKVDGTFQQEFQGHGAQITSVAFMPKG